MKNAQRDKTILFVDDDKDICNIMNLLLRTDGCAFCVAHDGQTAIDLIGRNSFDLVISDQFLPGELQGITVLTHHSRMWPHKGRILLTGYCSDQLVRACKEIRALYLLKPCLIDQLKTKIDTILSSPASLNVCSRSHTTGKAQEN
jgi:DNA-binding NtrC family response regulator